MDWAGGMAGRTVPDFFEAAGFFLSEGIAEAFLFMKARCVHHRFSVGVHKKSGGVHRLLGKINPIASISFGEFLFQPVVQELFVVNARVAPDLRLNILLVVRRTKNPWSRPL